MDIKEVHRIVASIKSNLFKNANSFAIGMLKSHFKGSGLKFKEHQVYTHGDDVRFIDWKMLAKTNSSYIKTFEEERSIEISILLDLGPSMFMGYEGKSKLECALEITCLLYFLSSMTGDYIRVILCNGNNIIRIGKKQGESGIIALIAQMKDEGIFKENGKINFNYHNDLQKREGYFPLSVSEYKKKMVREFHRKKELVILSDFYDFLLDDSYKKLLIRRHLHAFRFLTPLDYADNFKYSIKAKSFDRKTSGNIDLNLKSKKMMINDLNLKFKVKNLFLEKRYLEEFIKEML